MCFFCAAREHASSLLSASHVVGAVWQCSCIFQGPGIRQSLPCKSDCAKIEVRLGQPTSGHGQVATGPSFQYDLFSLQQQQLKSFSFQSPAQSSGQGVAFKSPIGHPRPVACPPCTCIVQANKHCRLRRTSGQSMCTQNDFNTDRTSGKMTEQSVHADTSFQHAT